MTYNLSIENLIVKQLNYNNMTIKKKPRKGKGC